MPFQPIFFNVSGARLVTWEVVGLAERLQMRGFKGNPKLPHGHDALAPGVVVGVAAATGMRTASGKRPKRKEEMMRRGRHRGVDAAR